MKRNIKRKKESHTFRIDIYSVFCLVSSRVKFHSSMLALITVLLFYGYFVPFFPHSALYMGTFLPATLHYILYIRIQVSPQSLELMHKSKIHDMIYQSFLLKLLFKGITWIIRQNLLDFKDIQTVSRREKTGT